MNLSPQDFEKLLCEFCKQDLPPNFTVEHDIKDTGGESGGKRQIDTKIKGKLGISDILICGEAKNWNEKVGSEVIDALVGKYFTGEIRANKVIAFSNQGFTSPAIERAKLRGIELLEPKEIGNPIVKIPHIVGVGYLGQMRVRILYDGRQQNLMTVNFDDYVILKGNERISFHQNVYRNVISLLRNKGLKSIYDDLSEITFQDRNVLYELKPKEGYRYNANFEMGVSLKWDYFYENLNAGILYHVNSGDTVFVNLEGSASEMTNRVLLSSTKGNFEDRNECIKNIIEPSIGHLFYLVMTDPDRNKINPHEPLITFV